VQINVSCWCRCLVSVKATKDGQFELLRIFVVAFFVFVKACFHTSISFALCQYFDDGRRCILYIFL
jgi:hypothetical protein